MPTYANRELILPGHWVKVLTPVAGGIWHHGIVRSIIPLCNGGFYIEIIHNVKNGGVITSSMEDFASGGLVFSVRRPASKEHTSMILATADANRGKPYSAFSQNCEHFCSFCYTWEPQSETVQTVVGLAAAVGVFAVLIAVSDRN